MFKVDLTPDLPKNESGECSILKLHFPDNDYKGSWNGSMTLLGKKLDIRITVSDYTDPWASFDMDPRVLSGPTGKQIEIYFNDVLVGSANDDNFDTAISFYELYAAPPENPRQQHVEIGYYYKVTGRLFYESKMITARIETEGDALKITKVSDKTK